MNFIIFFTEREGTSVLVQLLDQFNQISIVHRINNQGWEPFNPHNCGAMLLASLQKCLELIYGSSQLDMMQLNHIYTKTGKTPLSPFDKSKAIGLKMRFCPPKGVQFDQFQILMLELIKQNNIVVFVAVRQDVFRLALSMYHGDGTGKTGHLQFKVAQGKIKLENIPKITVDCSSLEAIISQCESRTQEKRDLLEWFQGTGVKVYPLLYEDFCENKISYFKKFFESIQVKISEQEIEDTLNKGTSFKKIHSTDISSFVINHEEVMDKFGDRYIVW